MAFVQATPDHNALVAYCAAASAIEDCKSSTHDQKKKLRAQRLDCKKRLIESLSAAGSGAFVRAVTQKGGVVYATLKMRTGTSKRLSPKSVCDAVAGIDAAKLESGGATEVAHGIMEALKTEPRAELKMLSDVPLEMRTAVEGRAAEQVSSYQAADAALREITGRERDLCASHKRSCDSTKVNVIDHLKRHDPRSFTQRVRLQKNGSVSEYVLQAKPHAATMPKGKAIFALQRFLEAEAGRCGPAESLIARLKSLQASDSLKPTLKAVFAPQGDEKPMRVSLKRA